MIIVLEENWGVSEQGPDEFKYPEESTDCTEEKSLYDKIKELIERILFGD